MLGCMEMEMEMLGSSEVSGLCSDSDRVATTPLEAAQQGVLRRRRAQRARTGE